MIKLSDTDVDFLFEENLEYVFPVFNGETMNYGGMAAISPTVVTG